MIIFHRIRWQNLLSTGNKFTEIELDSHKTTLMVGENGAGKSTILDAIMFGMFGRAHRNINKPNLVNSINQKDLLVEIEFSISNSHYVVRRGIKPNIFEIYKNDILVNQSADNKDYQDYLEKSILKMNHKTFAQIVMLGSANYVPFMQLPAAGRREFIEDLLDLQIFSIMNQLLKNRVNENKSAIRDIDYKIELTEEKIALVKQHIESLQSNLAEQRDAKNAKIKEHDEKVAQLQLRLDEISSRMAELGKKLSELTDLEVRKQSSEKMIGKGQTLQAKLLKEIEFYNTNDACPTCKQPISSEFKTETITGKHKSINTIQEGIDSTSISLNELILKIEELRPYVDENNELVNEQQSVSSDIKLYLRFKKQLEEELAAVDETEKNREDSDQKVSLENSLKGFKDQKQELILNRETLSVASVLLKDGGIKSKIVFQYIPVINDVINRYLNDLEFPISFELNEDFSESIRSVFRDNFMYSSFSEGEKVRINLSLLFAWREIAKLRNSASTNLLILDEVFDGSLDSEGTDEFMTVLNRLSPETNIFIISHKFNMTDKFNRVLKFKKHKNFSRIE